jgi:hypothetical protein
VARLTAVEPTTRRDPGHPLLREKIRRKSWNTFQRIEEDRRR